MMLGLLVMRSNRHWSPGSNGLDPLTLRWPSACCPHIYLVRVEEAHDIISEFLIVYASSVAYISLSLSLHDMSDVGKWFA